jgi:hypothetical protein
MSWPRCRTQGVAALVRSASPRLATRAYRYDFEISRSSMDVTSRQKVPLIAPVRPGDTIIVSERWF